MKIRLSFLTIILLTTICSFAQTTHEKGPVAKPDTPLKILFKPKAAYPQPQDGGTVCMQGSVTLKVEFLATGEIGKIVAITKLPYGATENAIEAAKKIRFVPKMKDGKPITTVSTVQFSFGIY
jgi:hypothetical protein